MKEPGPASLAPVRHRVRVALAPHGLGRGHRIDAAAGLRDAPVPGLSEAEATLLQVRVAALDGGDRAAEKRDQYDGGWPSTLAAFAAFTTQGVRG
jgi:hypothetical protein